MQVLSAMQDVQTMGTSPQSRTDGFHRGGQEGGVTQSTASEEMYVPRLAPWHTGEDTFVHPVGI